MESVVHPSLQRCRTMVIPPRGGKYRYRARAPRWLGRWCWSSRPSRARAPDAHLRGRAGAGYGLNMAEMHSEPQDSHLSRVTTRCLHPSPICGSVRRVSQTRRRTGAPPTARSSPHFERLVGRPAVAFSRPNSPACPMPSSTPPGPGSLPLALSPRPASGYQPVPRHRGRTITRGFASSRPGAARVLPHDNAPTRIFVRNATASLVICLASEMDSDPGGR